MAIKTLFKLNGRDYTGMILNNFKIGRHKLWGEGSGRKLNGDQDAVLVGIFPKITVDFFPKSELEMSQLLTELDKAKIDIEYYNPKTRTVVPLGTYSGDYEITMVNLAPFYEKVTCAFISLRKEQ